MRCTVCARSGDVGAELEEKSLLVPSLVVGAALVGAALGYWLARRDD